VPNLPIFVYKPFDGYLLKTTRTPATLRDIEDFARIEVSYCENDNREQPSSTYKAPLAIYKYSIHKNTFIARTHQPE
jgi:hypothetical protein